jgi:glutaredoxin-like protein
MLPRAETLEGKPVPEVAFRVREGGQWRERTTAEIFKGRTVVVFSLPGAYTPTCSSTHLPGYDELAAELKAHGVDDIVCIAVNDPFVMDEWKRAQAVENVTMIPDGNGEFTERMGLLVDKSGLGLGKRSWRYSMLVRDGVIEKMFIEPEKEGDPFEVSDAATMLKYLDPAAEIPEPVVVFARPGCPHCARAKALLEEKGCRYEEMTEGEEVGTRVLRGVAGVDTWPQVFIGGRRIGSADELEAYFRDKEKAAA